MMSAVKMIVLLVIAAAGTFGAVKYLRYYLEKKLEEPVELKHKDPFWYTLFGAVYALSAVGIFFLTQKKHEIFYFAIEYILLTGILFLIAVIDLKAKKVPNKLVIALLAVRGAVMIAQLVHKPKEWKMIVLGSAFGFIIGAFIIFVCILISRGGMGSGDMKLFAAIGLYFGFKGLIPVMMYSLVLSALVSIVLLISRKAKMKSTIAMAPFVYAGTLLYIVFI
ncbi:MAG: prepilin peptidase [Ruminococcus sp.]|nr:prepilin peptidase [Ruminococcus sp.]